MTLSIGNLFPIPLGRSKLEESIDAKAMDCILKLEKTPNVGNYSSIDKNIFNRPELSQIYNFCRQTLKEYFFQTIKPKNDVTIEITQSWANYSEKGNYHHAHNHANSYISGVFYIRAKPDSDKIVFIKESTPAIFINPMDFTSYNSNSWWMEAETGVLYLFPSTLKHEVEPNQNDETRISVSFNSFIKGNLGLEADANFLHIK